MKKFQKATAIFLAISTMFTLCISAGATEVNLVNSKSKVADVGTTATIKGELWTYSDYDYGHFWQEPTAKTIVTSPNTMAEVTVELECRYDDTGELVSSATDLSASKYNTNTVSGHTMYSEVAGRPVIWYSSHGATYSRSDVLYIETIP